MTTTLQPTITTDPKIAGDDWTFGVQFLDASDNPRPFATGEVPGAELWIPGLNATYELTLAAGGIQVTDTANGKAVIAVPRGITSGVVPQVPEWWPANGYPVRLHGFITDGLGRRQTYFVRGVPVLDWRFADLVALQPSTTIVALAGPAGPPGAAGVDDDAIRYAIVFGG